LKNYKYILEGLDCAACAKKVEDAISKTEGYENVIVNFSTLKLTFKSDKDSKIIKKEITQIVQKLEPEVQVLDDGEQSNNKEEHNSLDIVRIIIRTYCFFNNTNI